MLEMMAGKLHCQLAPLSELLRRRTLGIVDCWTTQTSEVSNPWRFLFPEEMKKVQLPGRGVLSARQCSLV
jgi:hypothetical protein